MLRKVRNNLSKSKLSYLALEVSNSVELLLLDHLGQSRVVYNVMGQYDKNNKVLQLRTEDPITQGS
jgi:hypothetical protein